ncbi:MAG: iron dicitrate transport regulator FecR, partial [Pseudomonadota bacterium]|nr:iron dicitrate transport regulator FecR [Pseudomonadota bacterium]
MTVLREDLADAPPPQTYPELRSALLARYDALPAQLKIVAQYLIDRPNDAALMTIASLSEATGVQPSA